MSWYDEATPMPPAAKRLVKSAEEYGLTVEKMEYNANGVRVFDSGVDEAVRREVWIIWSGGATRTFENSFDTGILTGRRHTRPVTLKRAVGILAVEGRKRAYRATVNSVKEIAK